MRIISGKLKGRRFSPPKSFKARPTTDFAKENLFNVLNNTIDFEGLNVLDLFGGTGSISYEFASRGANKVTCVELRYPHYKFIMQTIDELDLKGRVSALKGDAFKFVEKTSEKYDLIFADPPYDMEKAIKLPQLILDNKLLSEDGLLIFEHSGDASFNSHPNFIEDRINGKVVFTLFRA